MSIPMEMKKIAEKMSRTGAMVLLSTSEYSVSPSTVPMMNAPTAAEMCSCCPTRASPKHIARLTTNITSLDLKRATNLMMRGGDQRTDEQGAYEEETQPHHEGQDFAKVCGAGGRHAG